MIAEKTITICGHDVRLRYCAATETGYEMNAKKSIADIDFRSQEDLICLSIAAIVAAYESTDEQAPISSKDILYDATPKELIDMFTAVLELRASWYDIPLVIKPEMEESKEDNSPNA